MPAAARDHGTQAARLTVTAEDADVVRQVDLSESMDAGSHEIGLSYSGEGDLVSKAKEIFGGELARIEDID